MLLIHIGQLHGLAHLEGSAIGLFQAHDHAEERGLACAVRTDHAHNAVRRQHEVEVVEEHLLAKSLLHMLSLDDLVAEARTVRNEDLKLLLALLLLLSEHLLISVKTGLALSLTGLGSHVCPFELSLQRLTTLRGLLLLLHHALGLLVKP